MRAWRSIICSAILEIDKNPVANAPGSEQDYGVGGVGGLGLGAFSTWKAEDQAASLAMLVLYFVRTIGSKERFICISSLTAAARAAPSPTRSPLAEAAAPVAASKSSACVFR